ncbi:FUSC family protein [Burkholderia dolosa]|uniref:FUSC family protein n=1 Tax=Burkholderia dolosa TaxID=152500 RepID=UPI001592ADC0|nr:FUSC family protein [Burkholderia dolosa]MBR8460583.1 FUSC family protein [Burkholderia dolosa]MBY4751805.1 FUSC family protein [Burkholderia dolosa]MDN7419596.1 FUSC family protein [Burkholderia dolosa]
MSVSSPASPHAGGPLAAWYAAFDDWARTDGASWLYLFKALLAAFIAIGVSMRLDLPAPKTALTTVFIVMQPQSGAVLAKSFYRVAGTIFGLVATLAFVALFPQQPLLFLLAVALWVALCTAGAARNRNFRSYGFLLAGYTTALIGLPASQHPDGAFMSAMTRVAEIVVGIVSAGVVSALVFPQYTGEQMRTTVRRRFGTFVDYVAAALSGRLDRAHIETIHARFVADVVGFEAARSMAVFENPDTRMRSGRLARLNSEFMHASSRFHALHQLMNRLRAAGAQGAIDAIEPYFREIAPLLTRNGEPVRSSADAAHAAEQLLVWRDALPRRIRATRAELETQPDFPLLDFDTAAELLYRFITDLHEYAATYASLATATHERERWIERYEPRTNVTASVIAGIRTAAVILVLGWFWIETAWPSGVTLTLTAAATCALASSTPRPTAMSAQMGVGTALAVCTGLLLTFGIYPRIDGFPLLCAALAPLLAIGIFMTLKPKLAGYGMGYLIFFSFLAGPDNVTHYDPSSFMNDALALVLSMLVSAIAFAVLFPPTAPWLKKRLLADLRDQVVAACHARLAGLRTRFESGARDLMHQAHTLSADQPDVQRDALRWMFAVLEAGNAAIDLRAELATLPAEPRYAPTMPWRRAIDAMRTALSALFAKPDAARFDATLAAANAAIDATRGALDAFTPSREERHRLQRILSHLHFVRTALLDPESPLAALNRNRPAHPQPGASS